MYCDQQKINRAFNNDIVNRAEFAILLKFSDIGIQITDLLHFPYKSKYRFCAAVREQKQKHGTNPSSSSKELLDGTKLIRVELSNYLLVACCIRDNSITVTPIVMSP